MVKVHVNFTDIVEKAEIHGDFFLHPETVLKRIELALNGIKIDSPKEDFVELIERALKEENAQFLGITPSDAAEAIMEAIKNGLENNPAQH